MTEAEAKAAANGKPFKKPMPKGTPIAKAGFVRLVAKVVEVIEENVESQT